MSYAAQITGSSTAGARGSSAAQQADSDDEDFIYGRLEVHSDDEDAGPHNKQPRQPRFSAPDKLTSEGGAAAAAAPDSSLAGTTGTQQQQQQLAGLNCLQQQQGQLAGHSQQQQQHGRQQHQQGQQLSHLHCHSDGELLKLDASCLHQQLPRNTGTSSHCTGSLIRLDSEGPAWMPDFEGQDSVQQQQQQQQQVEQQPDTLQQGQLSSSSNSHRPNGGAAEGSTGAAAAADELDPGDKQQQQLPDDFDYNGEVPDHDHSQKRQELLIYAIPLTRGKVIFLPVCPWRTEPEQAKGWKKAVVGHVGRVQGEASELWEKFATAEQGTVANKVYRLGKRVLDSISPEERLMRGVPKDISKVIIHHTTLVSPESIMEQMHTMTKSYGLAAVGRAAAATVMLPLAVGVDLVILPGPQVLTYYTMWQLYRNTDGALGTTRMTKFITQGGSSENIRVNYVIDPRLDRYYDSALDCPEGVLPADDIDALVADLREPSLQEALHSLRTKALRDSNRRTSKGGDEYVSLPPADPAAAPSGFGGGSGGGSSSLI
uniref:Uncharacterized protein n=1 Tax=Tetradesmus obliquus TaxID=3088 RepID=A0A383WMF8_TETOB|eukprot:jgi/Sobl393_1/11296/SZX78324.1